MKASWQRASWACFILLAGCWVYAPALRGGWQWDDDQEVSENRLLRDPHGLEDIWLGKSGPDYFPLKSTLEWLEWHLWGGDVIGYHLVSLGCHLLCALLFWRLLEKLGVGGASWLGGVLFTVHPLTVESVAWISELKNTLSLAFLLFSMLAWVEYDRRSSDSIYSGRPYGAALFCFILALLAKSSVAMFPVALLLHAWWKRSRIGGRDLLATAPFFAASLAFGLISVWFQKHRAIAGPDLGLGGPVSRLAAAGLAAAFYLSKFFWPSGLLPIYPRWALDPPTALQFLPWLCGAVLFAFLWAQRRTWGRHVLFGLGFFLVNLLPAAGLIPMAYLRISWVADHFAYLPMLGLIGLEAAGLGLLWEKCRAPALGRFLRPAVAAAVAALALLLAVGARHHSARFRDQESLWAYTLQSNPNAWPAHKCLGDLLLRRGHAAAAAVHFAAALHVGPDYAGAHGEFGDALLQSSRMAEAIEQYQEALRREPDNANLHNSLGNAFLRSGRQKSAIAHYQIALRLKPGFPEAHNNLGATFAEAGRLGEAMDHYREAIRLNPAYSDAHNNLGNALLKDGHLTEAVAEYRAALRINPANALARANLQVASRALPER